MTKHTARTRLAKRTKKQVLQALISQREMLDLSHSDIATLAEVSPSTVTREVLDMRAALQLASLKLDRFSESIADKEHGFAIRDRVKRLKDIATQNDNLNAALRAIQYINELDGLVTVRDRAVYKVGTRELDEHADVPTAIFMVSMEDAPKLHIHDINAEIPDDDPEG